MQKHLKTYRDFFDIGDQDIQPPCEWCGVNGIQVHHIFSRGLKGFVYAGKGYLINDIMNLIGLCPGCHSGAHGGNPTKLELLKRHKKRILNHG